MTSKLVAVATAAALALYSGPAGASTTFLVATTGTDSAACGPTATPCKTIQFALDKAAPGDAVDVRAGTYAECLLVAPGTGVGGVILENEGFSTTQTTFGSILDGTGVCDTASGTPGPVVTVFDQSTVQGFTIKNGGDSDVVGLGAVTIATNKISAGTTTSIGGGIYLATGANLTDATLKAQIVGNTIESCTADLDGGGIYVDASASGVPSVVEIDANTIATNTAGGVGGAFGGGVTVFTDTASATDVSTVTITANTITGNVAKNATAGAQVAYGGGIFVATGGTSGLGTESVTIGGSAAGTGNIVRSNTSEGFGGGISINLQPVPAAIHSIVVERNAITSNSAAKGGGGIHSFATGTDLVAIPPPPPPAPPILAATMDIEGNTLTGNHATGAPTDFGGGGMFSENYLFRTPTGVTSLQIARNSITSNDSTSFGGGASLLLFASDDPNGDGVTSATDATMEFANNLLAENAAHDATGGEARGGGAYQYVEASGGQASATLDDGFLTVANNTTDVGEAGLAWDAVSSANSLNTDGQTQISLTNSIVSANAGVGVGGGVIPGPGVGVDIRYDDSLGNTGGDWDAQLGVVAGVNGILAVDPALDAFFTPALCSPTIDAGDPATPVGQELLPNGNRVNLGHLGGTVSAIRTLPDVNGDGQVDGLDVLAIAVSFGAASGDPRFSAAADRDFDATVDGDDLSYVAAFYGQACP
jgi:dockerin type I repeat protein